MKETILNKSKDMFLKQGFKTVGMDDIANALHISKKTIYQHFSSKDELVKATLYYVYDMVFGKFYEISGNCETPIHEHFEIRNFVDDLFSDELEKSVCMYQLKKYYPELDYQFHKKKYTDQKIIIKKNLKEGMKQGLYRKDIDVEFVSSQHIVGWEAYHTDVKYADLDLEKFDFEDYDYKLLEYHLRAIVTTKGLEILEKILKNIKK